MGKDVTNRMEIGQEIAVIGMAARFPNARNIDEFWENLKNGVESLYHFSDEELLEAGIDPGLLTHPHYVKTYGCLEDIEYFDAAFFGYTPKEAEIMDPQIRIFHECVWTALEHAGYDSQAYDGLIGLYAGATANMDWEARAILSGKSNEIGFFAAGPLIQKDYLSIRISYKLNLMGPSFMLSTACSTSLVAIHVASQAILNGECDIALAGGITVAGTSKGGYLYREKMVFSPDGHCRAFDAAAKGFVAGDGAGIVVLKRLEDATLDRDHIYAVIKGTAINNDGMRKAGFTASSVEGQAEVIKMALQVAEVEPESISYIEAHGTGTELGDPVEIEGLRLAYNTNKKGFCTIGSVKTNMGHLDSAAGVAGFIKTLLALMHRQIPPSLHFEIPNPQVDFINSPFYVNTGLTQWLKGKYPLRAGVSSFGIGGTNAHVILEEAPPISDSVGQWVSESVKKSSEGTGGLAPLSKEHSSLRYQLILLSAKTSTALDRMKINLAQYLKENPYLNLADAAYTLQVGRKAFEHRWMAVSSTVDETIEMLASPGAGETHRVLPGEEGFDLEKPEATEDKDSLLQIGRLWLHGHNLDWKGLYSQDHRCRISLPTYPFERQRYWIEDDVIKIGAEGLKQNSQPNHQQVMSDWSYLPTWKRTILEPQNDNGFLMNLKCCWLVFVNELPIWQILEQHLKENQQVVIIVKAGNEFQQAECDDKHYTYTLNPQDNAHYDLLFRELAARDLQPHKIVHGWNVTGENYRRFKVNESFETAQYLGFYSLLNLAKTLGKQNFSRDIYIYVMTDHLQEVIGGEALQPEKSTVLGLLKSIPQEYPGIRCRSIDICLPEGEGIQNAALIDALLAEFTIDSTDTTIAYRNNQRWVQMFDPLHLEQPQEEQMRLRKNGVYMVIGGLGNIGLMFAKLLAKEAGARLILTGRSPFPAKHEWNQWLEIHDPEDPISLKIKKLREIEALGGEVLYIQVDAAHHQQMQHAIIQAEEAFGNINGVIHAAGIIEGESMRSIQELSKEDCRAQFQAKVYGTIILEELLKEKDLDFCWLLSSISCVLGGLGFGAFASANTFMDVFAKRHNQLNGSGSRWFSLNWDGMEADKSIDIFKRMLPLKKIDQLVVSRGGALHDRIDKGVKLETVKNRKYAKSTIETVSSLHPRPNLSTAYAAPRIPTEKSLARIWQSLLGYDEIGIHDDFLELGGDSLNAITVISRIHQEMNANIPVNEFFTQPTIEGIARYISNHSRKDKFISIEPGEKKEYYALSSAQKRLYIIHQMDENNTSYNMFDTIMLEGENFGHQLESTFRQLIHRHEGLRTSFDMIHSEPVQRVRDQVDFSIDFYDLTKGLNQATDESHAQAPMEHQVLQTIRKCIRPFDLGQAPLLRVGLIKTKESVYILVTDMHHIISDGYSMGILVKEFLALYEGKELPPLTLRYTDYSEWLRNGNLQHSLKQQEQYWLNEFSGNIPELQIPTDYERPAVQSFKGDLMDLLLDEKESAGLQEIASEGNSTLFMVLVALYNVFLAKLSDQEDIVVGVGVAGRRYEELHKIIGIFVNTLAIRNYPSMKKTFNKFLEEVKEKTLLAYENQDYQFEELVEKVLPHRKRNRNPLFDAAIVSLDIAVNAVDIPQIDSSTLNAKPYGHKNEVSKFDMTLICKKIEDKLRFIFEYRTELFKQETIQRFIIYFKEIVSQVIEDHDIKLKDITISHHLLRAESGKPSMKLGFEKQ